MTRYVSQARDTSVESERLLIRAYREMPSWEKARRISELCRAITSGSALQGPTGSACGLGVPQ